MIKIPELVLEGKYDIDEIYVLGELKKYDFRSRDVYEDKCFEVCRVGGYRYISAEDGSCRMIGWQCNFASIQNYDICLPTIIVIDVGSDNRISSIHLNENFKGSQGIPCSFRYLERRLKAYEGVEFSQKNDIMSNDLGTGCRHTFEVMYGACAFREWCIKNEETDAWMSEATVSYHTDDGIVAIDRNSINGMETVTEIDISDFKEHIKYDHNGALCGCRDMKIEGFALEDGKRAAVGDAKYITSDSKADFDLKILKILSKPWMQSGKRIGIKNNFYFSHLWPTTLFGILVQMFAIVVYSDSYSYFQHCIRGLQKDEHHCACIGVCEDIDECMKYFPDFEMDDLF